MDPSLSGPPWCGHLLSSAEYTPLCRVRQTVRSPLTFERSRVHPGPQPDPTDQAMLHWTKALIELRKTVPALGAVGPDQLAYAVWVFQDEGVLVLHRRADVGPAALLVLSFNETPTSLTIQEPAGSWNLRLAATAHEVGLAGQPMLPQLLEVTARGVSLSLSPYAAVVYLSTARS